jgi:adenylate cyclase
MKDRNPRGEYKQLHELFMELSRIDNVEECLARALAFAAEKIPAAKVSAVLLERSGEGPTVRIAWQKNSGRIFDFKFSSTLLKQLSVNEPFFFTPRIADPTLSQSVENINSALLVPLWGRQGRLGVLYMDNRGRSTPFTEEDLNLAAGLASAISLQLAMEKQISLGRLEENLKQYFSPNVVRRLIKDAGAEKPLGLGVSEQTATIVFVDMQGFSEFCHTHTPREVSELLSPYFKLMTECIHRHGGYVDKFIGDAVMGVFAPQNFENAPGREPAHASQAVRASRDMIKEWANKLNSKWGQLIRLRIGVNTGSVVIGNVGFPGRMEYTALGDAVNLAARLQKLALPDSIALTDATRRLLKTEFTCEEAGERVIKGFGPVKVWHIKG